MNANNKQAKLFEMKVPQGKPKPLKTNNLTIAKRRRLPNPPPINTNNQVMFVSKILTSSFLSQRTQRFQLQNQKLPPQQHH